MEINQDPNDYQKQMEIADIDLKVGNVSIGEFQDELKRAGFVLKVVFEFSAIVSLEG
jgi:hypothetical protein